jgi:glutathione synthase/RimK-type ligase-like ATP-grasp enzyme
MYKNKAYVVYAKQRTTEWRHNLGLGAKVNENIDSTIIKKLVAIAQRCTKELKIKFCSVDIAELKNKQYKVVELNSGVMMEKYSLSNYKKTYSLYEQVIKDIFAI